jgi:glutathione-regulated potassium-efflux system ancillary protein KefF
MPTPPRILIIYAHSDPHRSRVNRKLADAAKTLPNVRVHDLYETYPDFHIDTSFEQQLLTTSDLVIFQHPIQWYGMPSLLKEWVDVVLEHGWAYGVDGTALRGKDFWLVVSTGGMADSYQPTGYHRHPFSAFLPPFKQTAELCGMRWLPPYILHGAHHASEDVVAAHVDTYVTRLRSYPAWPGLAEISHPVNDAPEAR